MLTAALQIDATPRTEGASIGTGATPRLTALSIGAGNTTRATMGGITGKIDAATEAKCGCGSAALLDTFTDGAGLTALTGVVACAAVFGIEGDIDASPATVTFSRRAKTLCILAGLTGATGFVACAAMIGVGLEGDTSITASVGCEGRTVDKTASRRAFFSRFAGNAAVTAMFCVGLEIDTGICAGGAGSWAEALSRSASGALWTGVVAGATVGIVGEEGDAGLSTTRGSIGAAADLFEAFLPALAFAVLLASSRRRATGRHPPPQHQRAE